MRKLLNIVAVSLGSGLILGAGLRALEGEAGLRPHGDPDADRAKDPLRQKDSCRNLLGRVAAVEKALSERLDAQETAMEQLRSRQEEAETRLTGKMGEMRQEAIDALLEGVQRKVVDRIARLEEEVAGQSTAMFELRECSLKTERSVQKLMEGIDRLISAQPRQKLHEPVPPETPKPQAPTEIGSSEPAGGRLRSLFG